MYILASRALVSLVESKHSVLCYGRIKDVLSHLNPYRWVTSDEYTDKYNIIDKRLRECNISQIEMMKTNKTISSRANLNQPSTWTLEKFGSLQNASKQTRINMGAPVQVSQMLQLQQRTDIIKSAHTALAVKACLLGGNSNTKCSMTFVNIAVAISALAGGGAQKRFRTETRPQKRFRTETRIRWCFRHFSRIFGCLSARGYWNGILGHFGSFPAMEKRPKMKKTLYIARFCRVFGCQSIENTAKTSVLDWRYSKKRVNYRMFDWKHYKNTVKSNVLEGFTAFMAKNV